MIAQYSARAAVKTIATISLAWWLFALFSNVKAQHNHSQHHVSYQSWVNKDGKGCCNDRDCGELADQDERENSDGTEVRIDGEWCLVLSHHYLKSGNAPNWQTSHVCVTQRLADEPRGPCQRLLCYQPKPGT